MLCKILSRGKKTPQGIKNFLWKKNRVQADAETIDLLGLAHENICKHV